ncbi:trichohyalin-like [Ischnura elegans]|uniref:trichohyalin-like n=1 Tax=Ischnura elegans TaxID=197161 RepID=UPI001ED8B1BB|nr:trichohyalin-like [Ischnura elegans]
MDDWTESMQLAKRQPPECTDVYDDGISVSNGSGQDLVLGVMSMVRDREKETRAREMQLRERMDKMMEGQRTRLDEEIQYEREAMRRRNEMEQTSQANREKRSREWEDRVIAEVMRREEELRRREQDFMEQWETQRTLEKLRALRHEADILLTERAISRFRLDMTEGERRRKLQGIKDTAFLAIVLLIILVFAITVVFF